MGSTQVDHQESSSFGGNEHWRNLLGRIHSVVSESRKTVRAKSILSDRLLDSIRDLDCY